LLFEDGAAGEELPEFLDSLETGKVTLVEIAF